MSGGGGTVAGSGTLNQYAKWTPDGFTLANGLISDDGASIIVAAVAGGDVSILGADYGVGVGQGGRVFNTGGAGGTGGGHGGAVIWRGGLGGVAAGDGGDAVIAGGSSPKDDGGHVRLSGGYAGFGVHGHVKIEDADTANAAVFDTSLMLADRTFAFPNKSGTFALTSDLGAFVVGSGTLNKLAKWTPSGVVLGDSLASDDGNDFTIQAPSSGSNVGAMFEATAASLVDGGRVVMQTGNGPDVNSDGGILLIATGAGYTEGGSLDWSTGESLNSGNGGSLSVRLGYGGAVVGGKGGSGAFTAGNARAGNSDGGDFIWIAGTKFGTGTHGKLKFSTGGTGRYGDLDFSSLTGDRTYTYPDLAGTVALTANKLSVFAATSSAELAGVISDETGNGLLVFATSPSLTTPSLGVATATTINKVTLTAPATGSTLTIVDGKTFTVSKTLTLTGTDSTTMTFPAASDTVAGLGTIQTFTAVNTFSAQDVHSAGIDLSTSGVAISKVATGASAIAFDMQDTISRSGVSELSWRIRNTNASKTTAVGSWDGRFGFGYSGTLGPTTGAILAFAQNDSDSPSGVPHYHGILASVTHDSATQTATYGPIGLLGNAGVSTVTGLTGKLQVGVVGVVTSVGPTTATGQIFASFLGAPLSKGAGLSTLLGTKDPTFPKSANATVAADHITGFWAQVLNTSSSTGYGTSYPALVSSSRLCIQDWGAPVTDVSSSTEYWAIYGENVNGTLATFPSVTGYLRMTYPRRTGRTGVRAMQAWWEPWANTSTIRGGSAVGDTYFDDGTNFAPGLHQSVVAGTYKRLLITDGNGRATAQTAANTNILTQAVGNVDGTFMVCANVLVTTATTHSFSVTVDYTDEGNTARTLTLNFTTLAGAFETLITNVSGAVPHEGSPSIIRCKSGTNIVFKTAGTFTTVTYNVDCSAIRLQ